jgi:hypothetical protein
MALGSRLIRWAGAIVLAAAAAGCMADGPDPSLTINRATWVQTSIAQDMSIGALSEAELIGIVADEGGGYVTRLTITGKPGTPRERIVMDTVLGTSVVRDPPSDEGVNSGDVPQVVLCFQFTIGWVDTMVPPPVQQSCPESAGNRALLAVEEADKIQAAANMVPVVGTPPGAVPNGRTAAVKLLESHGAYAFKVLASEGLRQPGAADLSYALRRLSFASGDGVTAVAMPVLGGGCVYEIFTPGDPPGGANPVWPAPLDDPCTGAAALAISGPLSYNPQAGG